LHEANEAKQSPEPLLFLELKVAISLILTLSIFTAKAVNN
jgi:hypothetical protein